MEQIHSINIYKTNRSLSIYIPPRSLATAMEETHGLAPWVLGRPWVMEERGGHAAEQPKKQREQG
jgi:hypothetical protein